MPHFVSNLQKAVVTGAAVLLLVITPAGAVFAQDEPACTPPEQSASAGVHWPTGSDAVMFTYQCKGDYSGKWLSAHYVFDPSDNSRTPLNPISYAYNAATDQYDAKVWDFNAAQGVYQLDTISVDNPPLGASVKNSRPTKTNTESGSGSNSNGSTASNQNPLSSTNNNGLNGSGANNSINQSATNNTNINNGTTVDATTGIVSFAGTGNATVSGNTTGGSAATGDAQSIANIINLLQSSSNVLNDPNLVSFTANINGDVNGDFLLDPAQLGAVQPANVSTSLDNNVKVNNSVDASLTNNVNLGAQSGDANVTNNTKGGDATSGNAQAVADIVNILNSAVTAGKSFVGVININGNLNGDILLPPNFVDTLLAANVPHYDVSTNIANNATVANVNNATVNNNVTSSATSGNANVSGNTAAGSATSGNADNKTNVTVFNLTGSEIVASNDLLVFVNVLGSWYGMIMNAPGATAASLGGGVTTNVSNNANLTNTTDQSINNNVNVKAMSGNANVSGNTSAGNAKTGDAKTAVSIANLINDKLSLSGWFGLLFINVFGNWVGSFGMNTSAGDPVATAVPQSSGSGATTPSSMFGFTPATALSNTNASSQPAATLAAAPTTQANVLAAATKKANTDLPQLASNGSSSYLLPLLGGGLALALVVAGERKRLFHRT